METKTDSHSISNISDIIRNHIHRDSLPGLGRYRFPFRNGESSHKNGDLESVSAVVIHLFQGKKLQENELASLQERVRNLITTDARHLLYDYYKDQLMKKGMVILREKIKHETGSTLLIQLGEQWAYFYREILPTLQAIMYPIHAKPHSIRQVTLLEFRNTVLLKLPVTEALESLRDHDIVSPSIQQMLLVLHSVHEVSCTTNYIKLEKMVARVTSPYLGLLGLYTGGTEPEIASNFKVPNRMTQSKLCKKDNSGSDEDMTLMDLTMKQDHFDILTQSSATRNQKIHQRGNSALINHPLLTAVQEHDRTQKRRYSIATT